ncbi:hypothetical protein R6Q57_006059 [Mikania cordata]
MFRIIYDSVHCCIFIYMCKNKNLICVIFYLIILHSLDIFATKHGTVISQFHMISLSPGKEAYNEVIDCWAAVLNFEEKIRSPSSLRRFFCGTYPFYGWIISSAKETDEERLAFFESHLRHVLKIRKSCIIESRLMLFFSQYLRIIIITWCVSI